MRCYSCGIELRDWEREDNPWQEHRRFSPNCVHLRLNGHQGGMQSIHSNNSQSDFHLEYGGKLVTDLSIFILSASQFHS